MKFKQLMLMLLVCAFVTADGYAQRINYAYTGGADYTKVDSLIYVAGSASIQVLKLNESGTAAWIGESFFQGHRTNAVSNQM